MCSSEPAGRKSEADSPNREDARCEVRLQASIVLRSKELREIVAGAPKGFGTSRLYYRYDVIFLKDPLTAAVQ